ncbi:unnamed protein product [Microthlaspi erraticum]|uniref:F-box domain-containing protein n=1 Tax=Microthlaspi erraticum TaxID=1685480 RepID=A0A6D2HB93_9BRAS|nr:unnamed protein product [Microthlaspi erraticum]
MVSPEKKRKNKMEEPSPRLQIFSQNPSLPHDLLMTCMARVSRLYYPTLSLVSKSFRSLLASPDLNKARSLLRNTERCLYVCLQYSRYNSESCRLYTLCRKPDQTLAIKEKKNKKSSGYVFARVPMHLPRDVGSPVLVAVGSSIYNIGFICDTAPVSSNVSILDCRFHTWHETKIKRVERTSLSASVIDQKIYVAGNYGDCLVDMYKVFDTETHVWNPLPTHPCGKTGFRVLASKTECFDGNFHVNTYDGVCCYNPKEGRWDKAKPGISRAYFSEPSCKIDNVMFMVSNGGIMWFDTNVSKWINLKGLVGLPRLPLRASVRMVNYGGNIVVLWEESLPSSVEKKIWCGEISFEMRENGEFGGES